VSTPYEESGRANQKQRTRNALVAAARDLIAAGGSPPTVEEAAAEASISRTTAYRYFPNQRALLVAAHPEVDTVSLLPPGVGDDPEERLMIAVRAFNKLIVDTEHQQRTMLRLSLDGDATAGGLPLRQGRAVGWFAVALAVLEPDLSKAEVRRLAVAIRSVVGIETLVWLTDVAGLSRKRANELMEWSARALLRQALTGDLP
jgi:AcrR family transcriptional regulator